ncbi:MAG TPA: hypothetical protein DDW27_16880 [Bacteroidales bacterium]|nr:hypothetical protein [Bacteroidales bacterium]
MRPGDKVLCINDKNWYKIPVRGICEGLIYTLTEVFECKCGNIYVRLAEVYDFMDMWCPSCNTMEFTTGYYHIERFRKIDQEENSEKETIAEGANEKVVSMVIFPN